ncbi:MAG TPA: hypothetical protein VMV94_11995 [Phycisphaerae bacterium]|nr:hypothetical protein [Phycisphaerae bacterium]
MGSTVLALILGSLFLSPSDPSTPAAPPELPPPTTRPACVKGGERHDLPADVKAALDTFRQALRDSDWDKALSCCTDRTQARVKDYQSKEQYLREFVPLDKLLAETEYRICGGSVRADQAMARYDLFLRLHERLEGEIINWNWWLERTDHGWRVDLPDVSVERWTMQELARLHRQREEFEARLKSLEPKLEGLRTQLTALQDEYRVGQPMLFRLELINESRYELFYDRQQVEVNGSMTIICEDGRVVPYTAGPVQTLGGPRAIQPGGDAVLFEHFDVAKQYDMTKPGKYRVRFNGHGLEVTDAPDDKGSRVSARRQFPSNTVEIDVKPGPLPVIEGPKDRP